jgi:hypothetical protein
MSEQRKEHKARHKQLQEMLDELIADYIMHTGKRLSNSTVMELMQWSAAQVDNPTDVDPAPVGERAGQ